MENTLSSPAARLGLTQPATYQIIVQGWLGVDWAGWFDGLTIAAAKDWRGSPITTLTGRVIDQAALHGLLDKLFHLGLPLLSIICLEFNPTRKLT